MSIAKLFEANPANIRHVSVPLEINQIKEFFENKELFFVVNYATSKIKGSMFLTYLANLELPSEIFLGEASKAERFELLKIFMETRNIGKSDVLRFSVAQILLEYRGADSRGFLVNPLLSKEDCQEFIAQNPELVKRWNTFLESTLVYLLTSFRALEEAFQFSTQFQTIQDPNYLGNNVVQLFSVPRFMELFFSTKSMGEIYYFKTQFEEYMYKGKNLFEYFYCPENTILAFFNGIVNKSITLEDIQKLSSAGAP